MGTVEFSVYTVCTVVLKTDSNSMQFRHSQGLGDIWALSVNLMLPKVINDLETFND